MNYPARPGDYIVTRRPHVWETIVEWSALTLWAVGVGGFVWTVVTLLFSLGRVNT